MAGMVAQFQDSLLGKLRRGAAVPDQKNEVTAHELSWDSRLVSLILRLHMTQCGHWGKSE